MSRNLYIAATEAESGKSLIVLGIMNILTRHIKRVGLFRPIIRLEKKPDHDINLVSKRFKLPFDHDLMYGMTSKEAFKLINTDDFDTVITTIINKYKKLESECDFVLIEGTDFTGSLKPFEFEFNSRVANNLNAPILAVVCGKDKNVDKIANTVQLTKSLLINENSNFLGILVNRVKNEHLEEVVKLLESLSTNNEINFVVPELELLQKLTIRQIANALKANHVYGDENVLDYDVTNYKVGAMTIENILKHNEAGTLVITPSDRSDILITLFMTFLSDNFPKIAGIILTGGFKINSDLMKLIRGIKKLPVAIFEVDTDTYTTAININNTKATLKPDNERRLAMAQGHFEAFVDDTKLKEIIDVTPSNVITPIMFEYELFERARSNSKHIVLPEGMDDRILRAAEILLRRNVVEITLLGNEDDIFARAEELHLKLAGVNIIDPYDNDLINDYALTYYHLRKHKGITKEMAFDAMHDVSYFGTMMVFKNHADGMVSGAAHTTQHTIRPSFEFIKSKPEFSIISSCFLMCFEDRVLAYGDCAFNPNPNSEELADIAISSADTASLFGIEPRIAMLSYSTGESGKGKDVDKVREATEIARKRRPDIKIEGPIQYDAAYDASVALKKMPNSEVAGKATVYIFPDLNTGNNTYKAVQRASNALAVGPVSQGLNKPVNDLSRGCSVKDIVNTVLITAIQAQQEA